MDLGRKGGEQPAVPGWGPLRDPLELVVWEAACEGGPPAQGFFRPALLGHERLAVLALRVGTAIVAGATLSRSEAVIGIGNVFDLRGDLEQAFAGATAAALRLWGELPVVGYESGDRLAAAQATGFESVGELIVWSRDAPLEAAAVSTAA